jgi:hypothetical protein
MTNEAGTPDPGTPDAAARSIPAEVLAETKGARTVVAPTDDGSDGAYRQGRAVAIALCAALNARLVLVDQATESWWIDPYGSGHRRHRRPLQPRRAAAGPGRAGGAGPSLPGRAAGRGSQRRCRGRGLAGP